MRKFDVASSQAPTNIAVVKYWGKDLARGGNTPINSSCSLTLDPEDLRAETVMVASPELGGDELWLNGSKVDTSGDGTHAKRLRKCLAKMRSLCAAPPAGSAAKDGAELASWPVRVISRNTFPTAAGLASSAAGYAALVKCAAALYGVEEASPGALSAIAREGSGSACRSLDGGLVAWRKGVKKDGSDSKAEPFFDETYWPELRVVVVVASADEKETPSTEGMQRSVETSPFLAHRAATVADPRVEELKQAFAAKDFAKFGELCMRDSNSFHSTCLDTYPPIFYLNATSKRAIDAVHAFNRSEGRVKAAYTFDAGPNAVVFCDSADSADAFAAFALELFAPTDAIKRGDVNALAAFTNRPGHLAKCKAERPADPALVRAAGGAKGGAKMMYLTKVGSGASTPLKATTLEDLVDLKTGAPQRAEKAQWQKTLERRGRASAATPTSQAALAVAALALVGVVVAKAR